VLPSSQCDGCASWKGKGKCDGRGSDYLPQLQSWATGASIFFLTPLCSNLPVASPLELLQHIHEWRPEAVSTSTGSLSAVPMQVDISSPPRPVRNVRKSVSVDAVASTPRPRPVAPPLTTRSTSASSPALPAAPVAYIGAMPRSIAARRSGGSASSQVSSASRPSLPSPSASHAPALSAGDYALMRLFDDIARGEKTAAALANAKEHFSLAEIESKLHGMTLGARWHSELPPAIPDAAALAVGTSDSKGKRKRR
jgi:hypothetical protein